MTTDNLPPLPEPVAHLHSNGDFCIDRRIDASTWPVCLYTAAQVEEIRRAAILAERERWKEEIEAQEEKYFLLASELVYNGNSVQHWCSKAKAYGDAIMQCWDVLKGAGRPPDGKTRLHEAIAAAIREGGK